MSAKAAPRRPVHCCVDATAETVPSAEVSTARCWFCGGPVRPGWVTSDCARGHRSVDDTTKGEIVVPRGQVRGAA